MTDIINEQISTLIDGELPDEELEFLLHSLMKDDELQAIWWSYHVIRDAIREDLPEVINMGTNIACIRHQVSDDLDSVPKSGVLQRFIRPFAGIAIAASVAMFAVTGVMYKNGQFGTSLSSQTVAVSQKTKQQRIEDNFIIVPGNGWQSAKPAAVSHLNDYLVDHSRYAGFGSARGIISYSRLASYGPYLKKNRGKMSKIQGNNISVVTVKIIE